MVASRLTQTILPPDTDQYRDLCEWIVSSCDATSRVLDIGAGDGDVAYPEAIKPHIGSLVGVDPDPAVLRNGYLDAAHHATIEEFALECNEPFDAAFAVYVVEHVDEPRRFLDSVRSCLKPGGAFFGVTPNMWHYFGLTARAAAAIGVEEWLLHRLRGAELTDHYHFPVRYRMNTVSALGRVATAAGFRSLDIHHLDDPGVFEGYFPRRFRRFPTLYSRAVYRIGRPAALGTLIFRMTT